MQNSWSEDKLVVKMLEKLQPWVPTPSTADEDRNVSQAPPLASRAGGGGASREPGSEYA